MDFSFVGPTSNRKRPAEDGAGAGVSGRQQPPRVASTAFRLMGACPNPSQGPQLAPESLAAPCPPQQQQQASQGPASQEGDRSAPDQHPPPPAQEQVALTSPPPNTILVSPRQKGNPLLRFIRNVRWAMMDASAASPSGPDYLLGDTSSALFLSLRYHLLNPEYIHGRMRGLARASFRHRFLLCHVDTDDCERPLEAVTKAALRGGFTLLLAWSSQEAARWLETLKAYESKPANTIQERVDADYLSRLTSALTALKGVNKTDVVTMGRRFGSLAALAKASMEDLSACPGLGPTKVARLHDAFHQPFRRSATGRPAQEALKDHGKPGAQGQSQKPPFCEDSNVGEEDEDACL